MKRYSLLLFLLTLLLLTAAETKAYTYTYYIINKKGEATLWFREKTQSAGEQPSIPNWMKSPLVTKYHYWSYSSFDHDTSYDRGNACEYKYYDGSNDQTDNTYLKPKHTVKDGAEELAQLPSEDHVIFVTYDVKEDMTINIRGNNVHIDMTGNTYYNMQDVWGWYVFIDKEKLWMPSEKVPNAGYDNDNKVRSQVVSMPLDDTKTWAANRGVTSNEDTQLLWSFYSETNDPYDVKIKNKAALDKGCTNYILTNYDWECGNKLWNGGNQSFYTSATYTIDGKVYHGSGILEEKIWNDKRIYMMDPSTQRSNNGFVYFKFAFLSGEVNDVVRIAAASNIVYNNSKTYPSLRLIGLKSRCYNESFDGKNVGDNYGYKYGDKYNCAGSLVCGESCDDVSLYHNNDLYQTILTPRNVKEMTYHLIDDQGKELMSIKKEAYGNPIVFLPNLLKSAHAKNYRFYEIDAFSVTDDTYTLKDDAIEVKVISETTSTDLYVKYEYDELSDISLSSAKSYNFSVGGKYLITDEVGTVGTAEDCDDNDKNVWTVSTPIVDGQPDPYRVSFVNKAHGKYLSVTAEGQLVLSDTPQFFFFTNNNAGGYNIVLTAAPTYSATNELQMAFLTYDLSGTITVVKSSSSGSRSVAQLLDIDSIKDFHLIGINGQQLFDKRVAVTFEEGIITLPDELKSTYAKDYTFYSDEACTRQITIDEGQKNIYVKYTYNPDHGGLDLSKTKQYSMKDAYEKYLHFNGDTLSLFDMDEQTGELLWQVEADNTTGVFDPYLVSVVSKYSEGNYLAHDHDDNLIATTEQKRWMITTTEDGKTQLVDYGHNMKADIYTFTEVTHATYDYTFYIINKKGWTGLWYKLSGQYSDGKIELPNFMRSQLVSQYHFYTPENIIHKSMEEAPDGRPLYKCYYYANDTERIITNPTKLAVFVGKYEKGSRETMTWPRKTTDIFVFYDVKPDSLRVIDGVHIDLKGQSYYNIQDSQDAYLFMDKRYVGSTDGFQSQIFSFEYDKLQQYRGVSSTNDSQMMWSFFSENEDPYDVQIKNKLISQSYPDYVVVERAVYGDFGCPDGWPTEKGGDNFGADGSNRNWITGKRVYVETPEQDQSKYSSQGRINSFAFLQGTSENITKIAGNINGKSSPDGTCFRFFGLRGYYNVKDDNTYNGAYYGLMRGEPNADVNKYLNNDLYRVKLTEYSSLLTYHVINLSGKEATSVSDYYSTGQACNLSKMIKSPFATNYKYYLPQDVTKAADGTITVNEGAVPISVIPNNTTDIYVTYEYDPTNTTGINLLGRHGTILYNISSNGKYLSTDGTGLTVGTAASKLKNNLWVLECNLVNDQPDPYDVHIYSWSNYDNYLGGEPLTITDKDASTSFFLCSGTSNNLFTLAQAKAVVDDVLSGAQKLNYLSYDGTTFSLVEDVATSAAVQTTLTQQLGFTYHIINLSKEKSLTKGADDLLTIHIPYELSSPAVDINAYQYYTKSAFTIGADGSYTLNEDAEQLTSYSLLAENEYDIYVTYTYDPATSAYDLTGTDDYSIIMNDGSYACAVFLDNDQNREVWAPVPDEHGYLNPKNDANNNYTIYDPRALWSLHGNDPYKVGINNLSRTKYTWIGSASDWWKLYLYNTAPSGTITSHLAILNMKGGDLRIVGVPYSYSNTVGPNGSCEWFCFNPNSSHQLSFNRLSLGIENSRTRLVKRIKPDYTYILKRKTDGNEIRLTKANYEGAEIAIPRELERHFCTYKYYSDAVMTNEVTTYSADLDTIYVDYSVRDGIFMESDETPATHPEKTFFFDVGTKLDGTYNTLSQHTYSIDQQVDSDIKVGNVFQKINIKGLANVQLRFNSPSPNHLLWYFRGDPYCCQVFNVMAEEENLVPIHRKQALNINKFRRDVQLSSSMMASINADKQEGQDDFHWEMVDSRRGMAEDGMSFTLQFKETVGEIARPEVGDAVPEREIGKYYYFTPEGAMNEPATTGNKRFNMADGVNYDKVMMEGGKIYTFDKNNRDWSALTLRRQARVSANVYNATNFATSVTKNEVSEYYAVGEKFDALPNNLRRKFCTYTLIDPDDLTDLPGSTLYTLTKPKWGTNGKIQTHYIYARYRVDEVNPFTSATEEDGMKILEDANTKWFNFKINGNYIYFNRNYVGKDDNVKDNDHRIIKKTIKLESKDSLGNYILPKEILFKGLHWAFVGDPYRFYVVGHRHRTATYDATGYKMLEGTAGYLKLNRSMNNALCMSDDRDYFTMMMDATDMRRYFVSLSQPRLTAQENNGNINLRQGSYQDNNNWFYGFSGYEGDNYSRGESVELLRVKAETDADKETAQAAVFGTAVKNDVFDCILNVYNGENKVVASSGWTELLRIDSVNANSLPLDIQRYGCIYKCWADATMTKKQVKKYDEKMRRGDRWDYNGTGDPDDEVYVLDDGCFIYTNYSYNPAHYSSDNNYHWVNCRFNWRDLTDRKSVWSITKGVEYLKTDAGGQHYLWYGDSWKNDFDKAQDVYQDNLRYLSGKPTPPNEPSAPDYIIDEQVFGDVDSTHRDDPTKKEAILWALVGDPYEFQIKSYLYRNNPFENYYLKVINSDQTGKTNYLRTVKQDAVDYDINNRPADQPIESTLTPAQKQGFTFTYKVDTDGKPYLALKDERATALSRRDPNDILIGAVKSYVTFDYASAEVVKSLNSTATVNGTEYTRGTAYDITAGNTFYEDAQYTGKYNQMQLPFTAIENSDFVEVLQQEYNYTAKNDDDTYIYPVGGMSSTPNTLNTGGAKNFYVEPMTATAKSVVFRLKYFRSSEETGYPKPTDFATLNLPAAYFNEAKPYPVTMRPEIADDYLAKEYEVKDYGVGTSLLLPWSYRRQYCQYFYRLEDVQETTDGVHFSSIKDREDISPYIGKFYDILEEAFGNYKVIFDVYYQTTEDYVPSTSPDDAFWYNFTTTAVTTQEIEPVQFTYSNNMHKGKRKNHYTDDWLWAVEGDPYGMKLHNRYAQNWDEVLTIPTIPITVNVTSDIDPNTGEPQSTDEFKTIILDPTSRGTYSTVNNDEERSEPTTNAKGEAKTIYYNSHFFEMLQGNYSTAFLLHPIFAEIQDAYPAYFISMFLFNAGDWPVQLNEMLDREAKRNASANWTLQPIGKDQLYIYYQRRGFVGGLDPEKLSAEDVALFEKLSPNGNATYTDLKKAQQIAHDKNRRVKLEKGYYRIKAMSDEALTAYEADKTTFSGNRYVTGYLSDTEMTAGKNGDPVTLNFWATTKSERGQLEHSDLPAGHVNQSFNRELLPAEYDPSSIFYFVPDEEIITDSTLWNIETQELFVNQGGTMGKVKATAPASATDTRLRIDDIGGTLFTLREGRDMKTGYINCSPDVKRFAVNKGTANELHESYDIQDTKWLLQPVGLTTASMPNNLPLKFEMVNGNDGFFYCSACLPFDILLSTDIGKDIKAYIATGAPFEDGTSGQWKIMCKEIGRYNSGDYTDNDRFVPAQTPVLIVSESEEVEATIPTNSPTPTSITANRLYGSLLSREVGDIEWATTKEQSEYNNGSKQVYVFGMANGIAQFYLNGNANPHNENSFDTKYLYHNKAFMIESPAIDASPAKVCIPIFGLMPSATTGISVKEEHSRGRIYDLQGRQVKTMKSGLYIQDRKKVVNR